MMQKKRKMKNDELKIANVARKESPHLYTANVHPDSLSSFGLHPSSLFNDASTGGLDKLDQRIHFRNLLDFFLDSLNGLRSV